MLPTVKFDARDSWELARDKRDLRANGESATFDSGTKRPWFGSHLKYLRVEDVVRIDDKT